MVTPLTQVCNRYSRETQSISISEYSKILQTTHQALMLWSFLQTRWLQVFYCEAMLFCLLLTKFHLFY